ncbi:hypothetical protein G4B88_003912 [Cannabis sativa]|uniref:Uncharacterized protein n=1 Tax=Cannabis sativa TaxID=3483 RepID=A0A7J6GXG8_CANSA|nr:hypothetical protein G4B88_003912 [Cannabis sativa]
MASPDIYSAWPIPPPSTSSSSSSTAYSLDLEIRLDESQQTSPSTSTPTSYNSTIPPPPPPLPSPKNNNNNKYYSCCSVPKETLETWDKVFKEGHGADVYVISTQGQDQASSSSPSYVLAHSFILGAASPVLADLLEQAKIKNGMRYINIPGVPYNALHIFIRFLYSSCYEKEELNKFVLHLLLLSHSYSVSSLKRICVELIEEGWLTNENVVDVLQLARNCDAPRLSLVCIRWIVKHFKAISSTQGWKVMKRVNPALEQELLEAVVEADTTKEERLKRMEEKKVYLQLNEAMEAIVHICRDGCRTIGPRDKVLKGSQVACGFPACKGLETLVRHFSICKTRVPGGCLHCKRMWQLLDLHSRLCNDPLTCKVPLCSHFKEKVVHQCKKDEAKWKVLNTMMTPIGIGIRKQILHSFRYSSIQPLVSRFTLTPFNPIPKSSSSSTVTIRTQFQYTNPISRFSIFLFRFPNTKSFSTDPSSLDSPHEISQPIDAGSSIRKPISLWPGMFNSPVTNALWEARSSMFEKPGDPTADHLSQSELVAKTPAQSRTSILYKLSSDYALKEHYRNPWNEIRIGKLLEDLDALAGTIAFKHCANEDGITRPLILVTASVDKMVMKKPISIDTDLSIVGAVTWVGRSSMEIQLEVIQTTYESPDSSDSASLVANFTFVARDSKTGKSAVINQISPETEEEKLLWKEADERNKMRKKKREMKKDLELEKQHNERLNALLAEGRVFCDLPALADRNSILMKDTCLENSFICQPQQRNIFGRIFGGFLMRRAVELAFSTTYSFAGVVTHFLEVDHVDFLRPVDVGDFLRLKSCVLYTELQNPTKPLINVEVVAHVTRPELRSSEVSNKFYFTFAVRPEAVKDGLLVRNVVPATEEEARRVLERMDAETPQPYL